MIVFQSIRLCLRLKVLTLSLKINYTIGLPKSMFCFMTEAFLTSQFNFAYVVCGQRWMDGWIDGRMDGWMDDFRFTSFSTVFQSKQDNGRVIMKNSM